MQIARERSSEARTRREAERMHGKVLVLDDDVDTVELLDAALTSRGHSVLCESRALDALSRLDREDCDVVITDLQLDRLDGLEVCGRILAARPELPVIVITGFASVETAVAAMRAGAYDFVTKPIDLDLLGLSVERALEHRKLRTEVKRLRDEVEDAHGFERLVGRSTAMRRVLDVVTRVAHTDATVLVTGESGTGKELVARAIHDRSSRRDGPFVAINCAAVPATLLESELFGHARGAFTDAKTARKGLFLEADGGTLFLDEIGEMPHEMQVKLLRALQERVVRAVGGTTETPFDARVIAATHRDLEAEVREKRFREDLYYRIHVVGVRVPPLREREGDVPLLAARFVERFAARHGKKVLDIAPPAMAKLVAYHWPGNVRELENSIERAVALTQFDHVMVDDLPERVRAHRPDTAVWMPETVEELVTVEELERRYLFHVLKVVRGNKSRAARILGYDRRTLYRKLERIDGGGAARTTSAGELRSPSSAGELRSPSSAGELRSPSSPGSVRPPEGGADWYGTREADGEPTHVARRRPPESPASVPPPSAPRERGTDVPWVLLVHREDDTRELLEVLLESEGFEVTSAGTLHEASEATGFDVVLAARELPDGLARELLSARAPAPVVVMVRGHDPAPEPGFSATVGALAPPEVLAAALRRAIEESRRGPYDRDAASGTALA